MPPYVIKLFKTKYRTVVFLSSNSFRYATYNRETEILNVGTHDDVVITTHLVSWQRFNRFLFSTEKEKYWAEKIIANRQHRSRVRDFQLENLLNRAFSK